MWEDPIVAEVRRTRDAFAAKFNYDLKEIYEEIKRLERASGRNYVSYPPKRTDRESANVPGATEKVVA